MDELRSALRRRAARGHGPHRLVVPTADLPLTRNGKVDRRALAVRALEEGAGRRSAERVPPRNPLEESLVAAAAEVLGRGPGEVGVFDNFFDLGGHSLLATRFVSMLHSRWGIEAPIQLVFDTPHLAALADRIMEAELAEVDDDLLASVLAEMGGGGPAVSVTERIASLTPEQRALFEKLREKQRQAAARPPQPPPIPRGSRPDGRGGLAAVARPGALLVHGAALPGGAGLNIGAATRMRGPLACRRWRRRSTRSSAATPPGAPPSRCVDGRPVQRVAAVAAAAARRWSTSPACRRRGARPRRCAWSARTRPRRSTSSAGRWCASSLVRLGAGDHVCLLTVHHLVTDFLSFQIVWARAGRALDAAVAGRPGRRCRSRRSSTRTSRSGSASGSRGRCWTAWSPGGASGWRDSRWRSSCPPTGRGRRWRACAAGRRPVTASRELSDGAARASPAARGRPCSWPCSPPSPRCSTATPARSG